LAAVFSLKSDAAKRPVAREPGRPSVMADRRLEVLRTAARMFSREGYRNATLQDVADALGIRRPALYYYARSKEELIAECGRIAYAQLHAAIAEANVEATGRARIETFFRHYTNIILDDFGRCFVLTNLREFSATQEEATRKAQIEIGRAVQSMIKVGIADGSIKPCDPVLVGHALFGAFNNLPVWYKASAGRSLADIVDGYFKIFGSGLHTEPSS
jgi:AcrR family transcriptional regulator